MPPNARAQVALECAQVAKHEVQSLAQAVNSDDVAAVGYADSESMLERT